MPSRQFRRQPSPTPQPLVFDPPTGQVCKVDLWSGGGGARPESAEAGVFNAVLQTGPRCVAGAAT